LGDNVGNSNERKGDYPVAVQIYLEPVEHQTCFAPLAVVGYCFTRSGLLKPLWSALDIKMKSYDHTALEKLQDVLVAIMAGCRSLAQVNTRIRPEFVLAQAWQRSAFAEQSNLSRTLDALSADHIDQLRAGNLRLLQQHSQLGTHNWEQGLILDVDPTSLLTSKHAEGSRKGWVSVHKNKYCRHVIRFTLAGYHENLLSVAYPGDRHGYEYFKPALNQLLSQWDWSRSQCQQIIIRSDAEQGTDANVSYVLWLGFQVLMKAYSGRRTQAWVKRTPEAAWQADPNGVERWAAPTPVKLRLGRRMDSYLLRWLNTKRKFAYATLLTTLPYPAFSQWDLYDGRGGAEVEIRSDKSGLKLHQRRKHSLNAQEAWIVLTDVAHNLLAWLCPWMLTGSAFEAFGPKRLVYDLFNIPGQLFFEEDRLAKVALWETHPYADEMRLCLLNLLKTFDLD
jgi:hypothetical protein